MGKETKIILGTILAVLTGVIVGCSIYSSKKKKRALLEDGCECDCGCEYCDSNE